MNRLYYGDCLTIIREHLRKDSVDLIYLDPPFNSNRAYNAIYKTETGRPLPDQIEAFCDAWTLDEERERAIKTMPVLMREAGIDDEVTEFWRLWMSALRNTNPRLLAYLSYMVERLIWMKGILRPKGSLYLHCDPTASHYIKVMLDGIFGHNNFRNEIIWHYKNRWPAKAKKFQSNHDVILFYSKTDQYGFTPVMIPGERVLKDIDRGWGTDTITRSGDKIRRLRIYDEKKVASAAEAGRLPMHDESVNQTGKSGLKPCSDVWDINLINPRSKERLGYATQKPLALLDRIIKASTKEGDTVLDPFCGCATTLEAAHKLKRKWIGIDIAIHAVKRVAAVRLTERLKLSQGRDYTIEGIPRTVEGAEQLWERDKYHFQKWAVELAEGFVTNRRSADRGIDGRIYFAGNHPDNLESMILEVKGGKSVTQNDLRGLRGALADSGALMAGLIILHPLGATKERNFKREMARAKHVTIRGRDFPKMQLLTIEEMLNGQRFDTPPALGRQHKPQEQLVF